MQQFTVLPGAFEELQKTMLTRIAFLFVMMILVIFIVPVLMSDTYTGISSGTWFTLVMISGVLGYTFYNGLKRQKTMLASYKLIITEESITREMLNTPTIVIPVKEIKNITKGVKGGYSIVGESKVNAIGVPAQIGDKEALERLLDTIKPIHTETSVAWLQQFQLPIAFAGVALMLVTFYSPNKYLATVSGIVFISLMTYSFYIIQVSKNIDVRVKRTSYFFLIPVLSVAGSLIMKWIA